MKIAQIAPLWETVPPKTYGGTELVVSLLTEELLRQGHEVTLFATGDSISHAPLISTLPVGMRTNVVELPYLQELRLLEQVFYRAGSFDLIHNHLGVTAFPLASLSPTPMLTTLHGAFKPKSFREFIQLYHHLPYISISDYQRTGCPDLNYMATIYHGLDLKKFPASFSPQDKDYLIFLGRFSNEKGPHHAIRIAKETGWKLVMAGKTDRVDREYFQDQIEPHIDGQQIIYIGEVGHAQKVELLSNAYATLCPVTWPEPFGLVLIESLACGTPVLAIRNGSIPEIIRHGVTGWIGDTVEELIPCVSKVKELDRRVCRHDAEQRFNVTLMTRNYLKIYRLLVEETVKNQYHSHQYPSPSTVTTPQKAETTELNILPMS